MNAAPSKRYMAHIGKRSSRKSRRVIRSSPATRCEIYFVRARILKLIKIGKADCALTRLDNLQSGSPDRLELMGVILCDRGGALEVELHRKFSRSVAHGEWFHPSEALLRYVADHAVAPPPKKKPGTQKWPCDLDQELAAWAAAHGYDEEAA